MAQFDVYIGRSKNAKYFIDLQDNILDTLTTRVVAPLVPLELINLPIKNVNPIIYVNDEKLLLFTHLLAAIPCKQLGKCIGNIRTQRNEIVAALDMLFTGV
ncbi:CcdB family protein [Desulfonatronum thioautotrophicum]|uniref:CcdB family protein n=1 Tax=Desulfonatronum thioautotrophicum TaxID=617001 RepID=UPI0005EAE5C1|nr:CcdB family protein [Desulfonatronum thioautotrophicum]